MARIIKIGIDVHSTTYTLFAMEPAPYSYGEDLVLGAWKVGASAKNVLDVIEQLKKMLPEDADIECGYEAGCLGFSLHNELTSAGVKCTILAPTTMLSPQRKRIKTDARDAEMIAQCLARRGFQPVHIPTEQDLDVKKFIRMRDDHREDLKHKKQQINSFCLAEGLHYDKTKWTKAHVDWLHRLALSDADRETLNEYLQTFEYLTERIAAMDKRIEELSCLEPYRERVEKLSCFVGVKTLTSMKCLTEIGDFDRFEKAGDFAGYLGLNPSEYSSGESQHRTGITKAGNVTVRTALVEAAESICRGKVGQKSKDLKSRQAKCDEATVAYADKGSVRMRRKYYTLIRKGKSRKVAVTAIARELACFIWGMMTGHTA